MHVDWQVHIWALGGTLENERSISFIRDLLYIYVDRPLHIWASGAPHGSHIPDQSADAIKTVKTTLLVFKQF